MAITNLVLLSLMILSTVAAQGGFGGFGNGGGFRMMRMFNQMSEDLTPQQQAEVKAIMMDQNLPKYLKKQRLESFFRSVGGTAEANFLARRQQWQARKAMMQGMFQQRQASMDPAMQRTMQQIHQIRQNENLSFAQERQMIRQIVASAPPEVQSRFQEMRERFRNGFGGFGSGQRFGGQGFGRRF